MEASERKNTAPQAYHRWSRSAGEARLYTHKRISPGVVSRVSDHLFAVRRHRDWELNRLAVLLFVVVGFRNDLPVLRAVQMFDDTHFHRLLLVVADFDLEALAG